MNHKHSLFKKIFDALGRRHNRVSEQALRETVDKLERQHFINEQAMEIARAGAWSIDFRQERNIMFLSERAQKILGQLPAEGDLYEWDGVWANLMASGEQEVTKQTAAALYACQSGQAPGFDLVYAYKRPVDGEVVWIRSIGRVDGLEDGRPSQMYGVLTDDSQSKKAEVDLREAHTVLKTALEMAKAGTWRIDLRRQPDTTLLSPEAARIYGCDGADAGLLESDWRNAILGNDRISGLNPHEVFSNAIRKGAFSYEAIYAFRRLADGRPVWLHDRGAIQRDKQGRAKLMTGVIVDVSEIYQSQEDIQQANRTLEQALDLSRAATWSRDMQSTGRLIQFSQRALRLF